MFFSRCISQIYSYVFRVSCPNIFLARCISEIYSCVFLSWGLPELVRRWSDRQGRCRGVWRNPRLPRVKWLGWQCHQIFFNSLKISIQPEMPILEDLQLLPAVFLIILLVNMFIYRLWYSCHCFTNPIGRKSNYDQHLLWQRYATHINVSFEPPGLCKDCYWNSL